MDCGEVAERLKAAVCETVVGFKRSTEVSNLSSSASKLYNLLKQLYLENIIGFLCHSRTTSRRERVRVVPVICPEPGRGGCCR